MLVSREAESSKVCILELDEVGSHFDFGNPRKRVTLEKSLRYFCIILMYKLRIIALNMALRIEFVILAGDTANSVAKMLS